MKNTLFILAFLLSAVACKKQESIDTPSQPVTETPAAPESLCYSWQNGRDSISMTMEREGNDVSGLLSYKWFEKDGNTGNYRGSFKGDTLRIGYTFQSEGMTSVREEMFLLQGNDLIKGTGKIIEKGGRQVFENRKDVVFDRSIVLSKTECR